MSSNTSNQDSKSLEQLEAEVISLKNRLRRAPIPYRESVLNGEDWDEAYDQWWHENASEASLQNTRASVVTE